MTIKKITMEKLTPATCNLHNASEGYGCNKTLFLKKDIVLIDIREIETWTIKNYENDRFGLLNGIRWLVSNKEEIRIVVPAKERRRRHIFKVNKDMTLAEIQEELEIIYGEPGHECSYQ